MKAKWMDGWTDGLKKERKDGRKKENSEDRKKERKERKNKRKKPVHINVVFILPHMHGCYNSSVHSNFFRNYGQPFLL